MSELDDMLHRAFANDAPETRFEFREEHWLQAKALLEADERRRKRLLVWWRVLGGALLIGLLVGGWLYFSSPASALHHLPEQPIATTPTVPNPVSGPTAASPTLPQPPNVVDNQHITPTTPTLNSASNLHVSPGQNPLDTPEKTAVQTSQQPKGAVANTHVAALPAGSISAAAPSAAGGNATAPAAGSPASQPTTDNAATATAVASPIVTAPAAVDVFAAFDFLQPKTLGVLPVNNEVALPAATRVTPAVSATLAGAEPPTKIHRQRGWSGGLVAGLASPTGLPGDQKIGGVLGTSVSYRLHPNWSLNADPLLRVRRAGKTETYTEFVDSLGNTVGGNTNDGLSATSVQNTYDFGYNQAVTEEAPSTGIWLEMPVYAQWHFKKLQVSGGVLTSVALLTRKQELEYRSNSLNPSNQFVKSSNHWETSSSPYFRSWSVGATAGIGWELRKGWTIEAKGSWLPQTYLSKTLNKALNDANLSSYNPYAGNSSTWFDLRVKWLFGR